MKYIFYTLFTLSLFSMLLTTSSCKKEEEDKPVVETDSLLSVKKFIYDITKQYYLWTDIIPATVDYKVKQSPKELFEQMLLKPDDRWSFTTEDYVTLQKGFDGIRKVMGYKLKLFKSATNNNVFAVIQWVVVNSPAAAAGLKRGNVITRINGTILDEANYQALFALPNYTVTLGKIENNVLTETGETKDLTAIEMTIHPVLFSKVYSTGGKKIGYIVYDQFIEGFYQELENEFIKFKAQGVNELVFDLRYNPGGYVETCIKIAGLIAPQTARNKPFLLYQWNAYMQDYITRTEGTNSSNLSRKIPLMAYNMDFSRVFILTSTSTASASESLISGLIPYMDVKIIGDKTVGKYTATTLLWDQANPKSLWGVYLVIIKMLNANNEMNFKDGFQPHYVVKDDYSTPIGDPKEPLLAKALELITGQVSAKSATTFNFEEIGTIDKPKIIQDGLLLIDQPIQHK